MLLKTASGVTHSLSSCPMSREFGLAERRLHTTQLRVTDLIAL